MCLKTMSQHKEEYRGMLYVESNDQGGSGFRSSRKAPLKETLCNCVACVSKRWVESCLIISRVDVACTSDTLVDVLVSLCYCGPFENLLYGYFTAIQLEIGCPGRSWCLLSEVRVSSIFL